MTKHTSHRDNRGAARRRFIRSSVLGVGFLSGLWAHFSFNPGNIISNFLEKLLLNASPAHAFWITTGFVILPIVLTILMVIGVYRRAGLFGFVAMGLAYFAGLWLNVYSIFLIAGAILVALISVKR